MNLKNKVNIHNRFDIEVRDAKTDLLKKSFTSYNIVLNQMYTRLCGGLSYFVNIHFGSSTGTLSATRTSLFSHLGTKAAVDEEIVKAIPLSIWKRKIVLNPEEYVGSTISEVGIAFGATNTNLVTHSLLKDSEGNPISIVKTDTDVITIYATVFVTFDNSNPNLFYIGMPSSNALVNYLVGGSTAPTGAFSLNDLFLGETKLGSTSSVSWTSDTANKQRKTNTLRFGTTVANGQVKFLEFANVFTLELPYNPIFNGQSYSSVSLGVGDGVKDTFEIPSANVKQNSIEVKLNGVVENGIVLSNFNSGFRTSRVKTSNNMPALSRGVSISPNGAMLAVCGETYPYLETCEVNGMNYIFKPVPSVVPTGICRDVSFSEDGSVLAVVMDTSPRVIVYDLVSGVWVARPTPSVLYNGGHSVCRLSLDGLTLLVAFDASPFFYVYDWIGGAWVVRANPTALPTGIFTRASMSRNGNKVVVVTNGGLFIYNWVGSSWTKMTNPSYSPWTYLYGGTFSYDGLSLVLWSAHSSPYLFIYDLVDNVWVKRVNGPIVNSNPTEVDVSDDLKYMVVSGQNQNSSAMYAERDGVWNSISSISPAYGQAQKVSMTSDAKYAVWTVPGSLGTNQFYLYMSQLFTKIKFNTPPAIGDVITADYTVDGIHKTDQYVIDVSFAIQFGEGS